LHRAEPPPMTRSRQSAAVESIHPLTHPENRQTTCPRRHRERPALRLASSGSGVMRHQSMIGNTALISESEMFGDRCTLDEARADQPHISRRGTPISTAIAGRIVGQTEARKRAHSRWPGLGGLSTAPSPVPLLLGSPTESSRSPRTRPSRNALGVISACLSAYLL
jgi:hypothetical protein